MTAWLVTLAVVFVPFLWFWGMLDCARRRPDAFAATGRSKKLWVWTNVLLPVLGNLSYIGLVRGAVKAEEHRLVRRAATAAATARRRGWYPDPTGRHRERWFDGAKWGAAVRDDGRESFDLLDRQPGA